MNLLTYSDIKTKLLNDLDIYDLDFVNGEAELLGYINEALRDAQSEIHTLGLDAAYFLSQSTITLASGTSDYSLPSDIFANRIKKMFYVNGTTNYEIFRLRDLKIVPLIQASEDYRYLPLVKAANTAANNARIRIFPTPAESGAYVQVWYIRNITTMTTSTSDSTNVCEIPECVNFLFQHVKLRIYEKIIHPNTQLAMAQLVAQRQLMIDTLKEMVPDENTIIDPDTSSYYEQSNFYRGDY